MLRDHYYKKLSKTTIEKNKGRSSKGRVKKIPQLTASSCTMKRQNIQRKDKNSIKKAFSDFPEKKFF